MTLYLHYISLTVMLTLKFTKISSLPLEYTDNNYENTGVAA